MKTYVVTLEDHDDVLSVRDKISWSKASRVLLVWPRRVRALDRRVDLLVLQRYAQSLGAQIAVVSGAEQVRGNAHDLGIPVFASAEKAQDSPWRRARHKGRLRINRLRQRRPAQNADTLRETLQSFRNRPALPPLARLAVFWVGVAAFLGLVAFFLPGAEIRIKPRLMKQEFAIQVWTGPEIKTPNASGGLPSQTISVVVEGRDQTLSTGQANLPDRPAAGQVTFTNLTDQPIDLPEGSVVFSLKNPELRFITLEDMRVIAGAGKTMRAAVRAQTAGQAGNVGANKIDALEGSLGMRLSVLNEQPLTGGRDRVSPAPNAADYKKLREKLLADLLVTAGQEIQGQLNVEQMLMPGTLRMHSVIEETHQPETNQPGDQLQLGLRVEYQALVVRVSDLQTVAQAALDANQKTQYKPVAGSLRFEISDKPVAQGKGGENDRWELAIERELVPVISEADLGRAVRGQDLRFAQELIASQLPLVEPPVINLFPAWWRRLPFLPFRIQWVQL